RLGARLDPPRGGNEREMLDQPAHGLKRGASRADDDRCTQLGGWYLRSAEGATDFVAARQLRREILAAAEASEIHDLPHPGELGGVGKVRGRAAVENLEVTSATHRVNEVIGDLRTFEGRGE